MQLPVRYIALLMLAFLSLKLSAQGISLISPKHLQQTEANIDFHWNKSDSTGIFQLIVSRNSNLSNPIISQLTDEQEFSASLGAGQFFWKVRRLKNNVTVDSSISQSFTVFDLASMDSLKLWLKASSNITSQNQQVSSWEDARSNGIILNQPTAARQATFIDSALNNLPVLYFDPSQDLYSSSVSLVSNNYIISSVYNFRESTSRAVRTINSSNNWLMGPYTGFYRIFDGNGFINASPVNQDQYVVNTAYANNDTLRNRINGQSFGFRTGSRIPANISVGKVGGDFMHGNIAELIVLNGGLDEQTADSVDTYLMNRYAPPVNLGEDLEVCSFPLDLNAYNDSYVSYSWSSGSSDSAIQILSPGTYYLSVSDIFNRSSVDSIRIIQDTVNYAVNIAADTTLCVGQSISLNAGPARYQYTWNNGSTSPVILADSSRLYKVSVIDCKGNLSLDSMTLTINQPLFNLGADTLICFNQNFVLRPDSNFSQVNYLWSDNSTADSLLLNTGGQYILRITDAYNCEYSDTIIISIDSSLASLSLGPDTSLCRGNAIGLASGFGQGSNYLWSTGDSTLFTAVDTAGSYTLSVSLNNCINRDTVLVGIKGESPIVAFDTDYFCYLDSLAFTDLSSPPSGDTLVAWYWSFGTGDRDSVQNPKYQYPSVGSFIAQLQVFTNKGCADTTSLAIEIYPKPTADFETTNNCSKKAINFFDRSTIPTGNTILAYAWNFGDTASSSNTSNLRKPSHVYDTLGLYPIQLIVTSDKGCKDTINGSKLVNPSPIISLDYTGTCAGDSIRVVNNSAIASGNLLEHLWIINNNFLSTRSTPSFKFNQITEVPIYYQLKSDSLCTATIDDTIRIKAKPNASFTGGPYCLNQVFSVESNSSILNDSIEEYRFIFDNQDTVYANQANFISSTIGAKSISLWVKSSNNCVDSIVENVNISSLPIARFNLLNNNTGIPFELAIVNTAVDAQNYWWTFGNGDSSISETPSYTYQDTGNFVLQQKVENAAQCKDSAAIIVRSLPTYLDAAMQKVFLSEDPSGTLKVAYRIANTGNNTIEKIKVNLNAGNGTIIQEELEGPIYSGATFTQEYNSLIVQQNEKVDFICMDIVLVNGQSDQNVNNNNLCEAGFVNEASLSVFPTPFNDILSLEFVLPIKSAVSFKLFDQQGRMVLEENFGESIKGYGIRSLSLKALRSGIFHYKFIYNDNTISGTLIKQD